MRAPRCKLCHTNDGLTVTEPDVCFVCKRLRDSVQIEAKEMREAYKVEDEAA